jgi:hypothetical protein
MVWKARVPFSICHTKLETASLPTAQLRQGMPIQKIATVNVRERH